MSNKISTNSTIKAEELAFKEQDNEVYYATNPVVILNKKDMEIFKEKAASNDRKRCRLCAHKDVNDNLHEMFIAYSKGAYVRPHKHPGKSISYHIVEGSADLFLFDNVGEVIKIINMGDYSSGKAFYYRISDPFYYTPIIRSDILIFEEITNGPFKPEDTVYAPWAPNEEDLDAIKKFMGKLAQIR